MRRVLSIALAFFVTVATAVAETYPSRPITIVVPFPAGGPTDALGRVLADRMTRSLNQSVIVENLTGAAGTIGTAHVAHSAPDGYTTILGHWQTHVVNGATFALSFDVVNDFEPISLIADCPMWLVGRNTFPPKNLQDLIAWVKENPGKATVGIGGVGGGADVVGAYFQKSTDTRFQICALSWRSADNPGPAGRKHRPDFDSSGQRVSSSSFRSAEGLRSDGPPRLMLPSRKRWLTRRCSSDLKISVRKAGRATNRRQKLSPRSRRRRLRNGGPSSRQPTSGRSEAPDDEAEGYNLNCGGTQDDRIY